MAGGKVFAIGFQKTSTSSLGCALELLGYTVSGYWEFRDLAGQPCLTRADLLSRAMTLVDQFDAFKDTPWPVFYKELDQACPGSKFIHIVRDTDSWIRSAVRDFGSYPNAIHEVIYGCGYPLGNEQVWIERYEQHNSEVLAYFSGRNADFISLHLNRGEVGWVPICRLLNAEVPNAPWPHVNKIRDKKRRLLLDRVRRRLGIRRD